LEDGSKSLLVSPVARHFLYFSKFDPKPTLSLSTLIFINSTQIIEPLARFRLILQLLPPLNQDKGI
jgi:hypothetical protein